MLFVGAILLAVFVLPPPWGLVVVGFAAVVEIAETFLWIRLSRRWRIRAGELWRARCESGADPGVTVRVVGRDGLTLLVEPE